MARHLNKTRLRDTKLLIALTLAAGIFCKTMFPDHTLEHQSMDFIGCVLVTFCALGRIYATAFIGGIKNKELITWGPYSQCRNPLYLFSLMGAMGIGLMSTSLLALFIIFFGFLSIYLFLIAREEKFLSKKFGTVFIDYKKRVPKLLPSFKNYICPDELLFQPKFLTNAVWDSIWWFVPYPIFEIAEYLQQIGIIHPIARIF